jgi:hypothetical protein
MVEDEESATELLPKTQLSSVVEDPSFVGFDQIKGCVVGATMDSLNVQEAKVTHDAGSD